MKYELQNCYGARLRKLSRIADAYYRSQLRVYNITENQLTILFVLSKTGKLEQGKIGHKLELQRSTISRNVKLLEKRELVSRTSNYQPLIELTASGCDLVDTLLPEWEKTMDKLTQLLGEEGINSIKLLEKKLK